ncbi:MAG: cytochrome c oxidase assembly protein [Rhodospirillaceae bacterium]|jgi:cytochrome c oxidase assembly protein subunit 11|nr:cytochrome c oxidase assembly protein [Rhodospirillaceae bacterium]MBT6119579.1 cytochrome c oxidase assembly protein [Rhodospirillaceae bacterium]
MSSNRRIATALFAVAFAMVGMAYASVPLYRLFCQVTGYGGTTQTAEQAPEASPKDGRTMTILFDANTAKGLGWDFKPEQRAVTVRVGEEALAFYSARNPGGRAVTGQATFNVTPAKAGLYFVKVECFCFEEQTLQPGQSVDMPVTFYVDPAIEEDPNLDEVTEITLSYTFFVRETEDGLQVSDASANAKAQE